MPEKIYKLDPIYLAQREANYVIDAIEFYSTSPERLEKERCTIRLRRLCGEWDEHFEIPVPCSDIKSYSIHDHYILAPVITPPDK